MTRKYNSIAEHWQLGLRNTIEAECLNHTNRNRNGESMLEPVNNKKFKILFPDMLVSNVKKLMQISKMLWWRFETTVSQGLLESNFSILEE